jgi:hypothetical protein
MRKEALKASPSVETRLEAYMDKLSTWQLMGGLQETTSKDELDWIQKFCCDIVEPLCVVLYFGSASDSDLTLSHRSFKQRLPNQCELLRSKVFPSSPFSDNESDAEGRSSPPLAPNPPKKARMAVLATSGASKDSKRYPSPALSATSNASRTTSTSAVPKRTLDRNRSRSLSLALAQEAEGQRSREPSIGSLSRRAKINREVSMSRSFKAKKSKTAENASTDTTKGKEKQKPVTSDKGVTLVAATPAKPRTMSMSMSKTQSLVFGESQAQSQIQSQLDSQSQQVQPLDFGRPDMLTGISETVEEEEIWELPEGKPEILKFTMSGDSSDDELDALSGGEVFVAETPVKKRPKK